MSGTPMKILFVGHSYHNVTRSSFFFEEMLDQLGDVERLSDNSLDGAEGRKDYRPIAVAAAYDLIVIWQIEYIAEQLAGLPNVVFVPMYDGCRGLPLQYWEDLRGMRVLALSKPVYEIAQRGGCDVQYCQYWPQVPAEFPQEGSDSKAYFWYRRNDVALGRLQSIADQFALKQFLILWKPDPSAEQPIAKKTFQDDIGCSVEFVPWKKSNEEQHRVIKQASFFVGSRFFEGIGLSFLEAMALGRCVIAPRNSTYSDYIISGFNGLLYDPDYCFSPGLNEIKEIRLNAWNSARVGRKRWEQAIPKLLTWLKTGSKFEFFRDDEDTKAGERARILRADGSSRAPILLSVVTVVRNAPVDLARTIENVTSQAECEFEYVILDGASTDNTLEIAHNYKDRVSAIISEPDKGIYDAMNKAARLASGEYVLFMNAGDTFVSATTIRDLLHNIDQTADFITGHHVYVTEDGVSELHRVADFRETYDRLKKGLLRHEWLAGIPCHQSTVTRRSVLLGSGYDTKIFVAADHDLMFRQASIGSRFQVKDQYVSLYEGGGFSSTKRYDCAKQWLGIALTHTRRRGDAYRFYADYLAEPLYESVTNSGSFMKALKMVINERSVILNTLRHVPASVRREYRQHVLGELPQTLKQVLSGNHITNLDFRSPNLRRRATLKGFSFREHEGTWTQSTRATIELRKPVKRVAKVTLDASSVVAQLTEQVVSLTINGDKKIDFVPRPGMQKFDLGQAKDIHSLELLIPNVLSPSEMNRGNDPRRLGLMIRNITLASR